VLVDRHGSEDRTARVLWLVTLLILAPLVPALYCGWFPFVIFGFIALYMLQNLWRPVLISRFDVYSDEAKGATLLSIESQAKRLAAMIIAPVLGYVVDLVTTRAIGDLPFWPVAVFGAVVALAFFVTAKTTEQQASLSR
jgi:hypothetical protein